MDNIFFVSLGNDCSTASVLRELKLRNFALPFDWVVSSKKLIIDCIKNSFNDYHTELKLNKSGTRVIDKYGFEFPHDYPTINNSSISEDAVITENIIADDWEKYTPQNIEKYKRRIQRFNDIFYSNNPIIILYSGHYNDIQDYRNLFKEFYNKNNIFYIVSNTEVIKNEPDMITCNTYINGIWNQKEVWMDSINEIKKKINTTIELPKNAILLSGLLKSYRDIFPIFVEKIVKPARADVFCVFKPNSSWKSRDDQSSTDDDIDDDTFIKECLGNNLKSLIWIDKVESTGKYIEIGENYLNNLWLQKYGNETCKNLEHWMNLKNTVDQYQRLKLATNEMNKYSYEKNIAYKRVLRARPDILITNGPKPWYNLDVNYRDIFINPHIDYEFRDMLFVTDQQTMYYICNTFPDNYPRYMPTTTLIPHKTILSPECQLLQFMIKEHKFNFYKMNASPNVEYQKINNKNLLLMVWKDFWDIKIDKKKLYLLEL